MIEEKEGRLALSSKQIAAIIKLNNVLGYLPIGITDLLATVIYEVKQLFPDHSCFIQLVGFDGKSCLVVRDGLPVIVTNCKQKKPCHCQQLAEKVESYICLPLEGDKEKLGIMRLTSDQSSCFSGAELEVILCIANQTALALQRYRLFQQLQAEKLELKHANEEVIQLNQRLAIKLEELQATQTQLIRTEKLAVTGQLTADLAHEINNPIAIILSRLEYLEWLLAEGKQPENLMKDINMLQKHTMRIASLTRDLLSFARPREANFTAVNVNLLIEETCSLLEKQLTRQGITIKLVLTPHLPLVFGNWDQLQQVLINLLYNARDAMAQGGRLQIKTFVKSDNSKIILTVADTGEGIACQHLSRIFDPFFTTKKEHRGTGLGLSISYNIMEQHEGQIKVKSKVNQGTVFLLRLKPYYHRDKGGTVGEISGEDLSS